MSDAPPSTPMLDPPETREARSRMVRGQLAPRGIGDSRVLAAMGEIPREVFAGSGNRSRAYDDGPLPIGEGQTISQPFMVASMSELLELTGMETVLEIGAGSGYGAAILSRLAKRVVAVERLPGLLETARARWAALGLENIEGVAGDGTLGWREGGPYHAISVTAAAPRVPPSLVDQLIPERGRMVIPVGDRFLQTLQVVRLGRDGQIRTEKQYGCAFVPLLGEEGW